MSYTADANNARYNNDSALADASDQGLLLTGHIRPTSFSVRIGLAAISTSADGRTGNMWTLAVDTNQRLITQYNGGSNFGSTSTLSLDTWHHAGIFVPNGFDGTSQTLRFYLDGTAFDVSSVTLPDYSSANFIAVTAGDGVFAETHHQGALIALYAAANASAADAIVAELQTTKPADTTATALGDFSFETAVPSGFSAISGISINSSENPPLGGGGPAVKQPVVVLI